MPGKHAPPSPASFYLSVAKAAGKALAAVAVVVVLAIVALGGRGKPPEQKQLAGATPGPSISSVPLDSPSPTVSPSPTLRAPAHITVAVLNGTKRSGLAGRTGTQITAAGYKVVRVGNAGKPAAKSTVYFQPGFELEALALRDRFRGFADVKTAPSTIAGDVDITLVIGADYP